MVSNKPPSAAFCPPPPSQRRGGSGERGAPPAPAATRAHPTHTIPPRPPLSVAGQDRIVDGSSLAVSGLKATTMDGDAFDALVRAIAPSDLRVPTFGPLEPHSTVETTRTLPILDSQARPSAADLLAYAQGPTPEAAARLSKPTEYEDYIFRAFGSRTRLLPDLPSAKDISRFFIFGQVARASITRPHHAHAHVGATLGTLDRLAAATTSNPAVDPYSPPADAGPVAHEAGPGIGVAAMSRALATTPGLASAASLVSAAAAAASPATASASAGAADAPSSAAADGGADATASSAGGGADVGASAAGATAGSTGTGPSSGTAPRPTRPPSRGRGPRPANAPSVGAGGAPGLEQDEPATRARQPYARLTMPPPRTATEEDWQVWAEAVQGMCPLRLPRPAKEMAADRIRDWWGYNLDVIGAYPPLEAFASVAREAKLAAESLLMQLVLPFALANGHQLLRQLAFRVHRKRPSELALRETATAHASAELDAAGPAAGVDVIVELPFWSVLAGYALANESATLQRFLLHGPPQPPTMADVADLWNPEPGAPIRVMAFLVQAAYVFLTTTAMGPDGRPAVIREREPAQRAFWIHVGDVGDRWVTGPMAKDPTKQTLGRIIRAGGETGPGIRSITVDSQASHAFVTECEKYRRQPQAKPASPPARPGSPGATLVRGNRSPSPRAAAGGGGGGGGRGPGAGAGGSPGAGGAGAAPLGAGAPPKSPQKQQSPGARSPSPQGGGGPPAPGWLSYPEGAASATAAHAAAFMHHLAYGGMAGPALWPPTAVGPLPHQHAPQPPPLAPPPGAVDALRAGRVVMPPVAGAPWTPARNSDGKYDLVCVECGAPFANAAVVERCSDCFGRERKRRREAAAADAPMQAALPPGIRAMMGGAAAAAAGPPQPPVTMLPQYMDFTPMQGIPHPAGGRHPAAGAPGRGLVWHARGGGRGGR